MSLGDLAETLSRGDPDRFLAAMAAPVGARGVLIPLYAFNLEVARAPWVTAEPLIAEMRLTWWRDALGEIAAGGPVRRHEVTSPLADVLDAEGARLLDGLVAARRRDIESAPFDSDADLADYLDRTAGTLHWTAARALGATREYEIRAVGRASGLANLLLAVPALAARGKPAFAPDAEERISALARGAASELRAARPDRKARPALLAAWRAPVLLARAARAPEMVFDGRLAEAEILRRGRLLWQSLLLGSASGG